MTSPLNDDSIIAYATFLMMLRHIEAGVDAVDAARNQVERKETIAALREQLKLLREGYDHVSDIRYYATHERGRKASPANAVNQRHAGSRKLSELLEHAWFLLEHKPRQDTFSRDNYRRLCTEAWGDDESKWIAEAQFKKRLAPSARCKT